MTTDTPESLSVLIKIVSNHWDGIYTRESVVEALTRYAEHLERTCEWRPALNYEGTRSLCGRGMAAQALLLLNDNPIFCPYCGGKVVEVRE